MPILVLRIHLDLKRLYINTIFVLGPVPGLDIPAVNFPEISMLNVRPWGGYGATPVPQQLQNKYSEMTNIKGGWSYSEGVFEDMNKVTMLQMYWNPDKSDSLSLREYATFEFSPEVADDVLTIIEILESNFQRDLIKASAIDAYKLAQKVDAQLSLEIQKSWRWRILYLRTLIDKEMYLTKGALRGEILKDAFAELTRIYHADNALDSWLRPPKVKPGAFEPEKEPFMDLDSENR